MLRPVKVEPLPHSRLRISYPDGVEGVIDLSPQMGHGVFAPLTDEAFSKRCISANTGKSRGLKTSKFAPTPHISKSRAKCRPAPPMPEVNRFYGIVIRFYYRRSPSHAFSCNVRRIRALIEIETGAVYQGFLPGTAPVLVNEGRAIHLQELRDDWNRAREERLLLPIAPLE